VNDAAIYQPSLGGTSSDGWPNSTAGFPPESRVREVNTERREQHTQILTGAGMLFATVLVLGLVGVLVVFAVLRENQVFWTNAGGYPIWLRDLVLWTFYPILAITGMSLILLSMACFSWVCRSLRFFVLEVLLLLACWGLLATTFYIAFSNNVINIMEGRDVHSHSQESLRK